MGFHDELQIGDIHKLQQYEYADSTARLAATGFVTADIGKVARQLDNNSFWILIAITPTWSPVTASPLDPATTVTDERTLNTAPVVGTSGDYAREDHTHGSPTSATIAAASDYAGRFEGTSVGTGDIGTNMWGWWWNTTISQLFLVRNRAGTLYAVEANPL